RFRSRGSSAKDADTDRQGGRGDCRGVPAADERRGARRAPVRGGRPMRGSDTDTPSRPAGPCSRAWPSSIVIVVPARMASTRLPGKVLMPLANRPLLFRLLERVLAARTPSAVVVATTVDRQDDVIESVAEDAGVACVRGHPTDLLDRHYAAGVTSGADVVVKIPSDCPLIDPDVIDRVIGYYSAHADCVDFVSNLHPATYPDGNDVEVIPIGVLETAWREATERHEREHTTPFIWERGSRFRIHNVAWESGLDYSSTHRWTIDYPEDYQFLASVYQALWSETRPIFSLTDVLSLLETRPDITALNACHAGKGWYRDPLAAAAATVPIIGGSRICPPTFARLCPPALFGCESASSGCRPGAAVSLGRRSPARISLFFCTRRS